MQRRLFGVVGLVLLGLVAAAAQTSPREAALVGSPPAATVTPAAVVDYNGDDVADLAVAGLDLVQVIYGSPTGLQRRQTRGFRRSEMTAAPHSMYWNDNQGPSGGPTLASADFNGDGFCDLAIGEFFGSVDGAVEAGAVHVVYGSATGLSAVGSQYWTQNSPAVQDRAETNEAYGYSLAAGDLGRGAEADLAIGVTESIGRAESAGAVNVLYGSPAGLAAAGNQLWSQASPGIAGRAEQPDQFGWSLAIADFDGSGVGDLAIGAPSENIERGESTGVVHIIHGSAGGLTAERSQLWTRTSPGVEGRADDIDFGYTLATGHLAGSPYADLAVGGGAVVQIMYGAAGGLSPRGSQRWSSADRSLPRKARIGRFSDPITIGDFGRNRAGNRYDDLVVSTTGERGDSESGQLYGGVLVMYGTARGVTTAGGQFWSQRSPGVPGVNEEVDWFGSSLAAADFGIPDAGRPYVDLVIGTPSESRGRTDTAGRIHVLYGTRDGLTSEHVQVWDKHRLGLTTTASAQFGAQLSASGPP